MLTKVGDLIDPASNTWDEDLIEQTMWPIDVQRILSIHLPQHDMQDFIAWNYTKNGIFSVRSAYFMEWDHQYGTKLKHSNGMGQTALNPIWSKIWKLACLGKVKIFLWRLAKNSTPTRALLHHRNMAEPDECCLCGAEDTWRHALLHCTVS